MVCLNIDTEGCTMLGVISVKNIHVAKPRVTTLEFHCDVCYTMVLRGSHHP